MRRKGLSRHDIAAAIRNQGVSLSELSRRLSPTGDISAVSKALSQPWPRIEAGIAAFLDMKPEEIWPERYTPAGNPIRSAQTSTSRRSAERLSGKAA